MTTTEQRPPQKRLKKFSRDPDYAVRFPNRQITQHSLELIAAIERYRVIPTSLLLKLVKGDPHNLQGHLKHLYHTGLTNRFCFFGPTGRPLEFNYFLDSPQALHLLIDAGTADADTLDFDQIKNNRKKWSPIAEKARSQKHTADVQATRPVELLEESPEGKRLILRHELMISRFHGMLELACRQSGGQVKLEAWFQGPILHQHVEAPKMILRDGAWHQQEGTEKLPHRPDALFTIQICDTGEFRHFFYEADRRTMPTTDMMKKFRGHFYYVAKAKQYRQDYSIQRIRAVLIETLDTKWAERLRITAQHPLVSGPKPSELFWFTASEFFTNQTQKSAAPTKRVRQGYDYLDKPDIVFRPLWFTPVDAAGAKPRSLLD